MDDANPKWNTIKKILDYLGYEIRIARRANRRK